MLDTHGWHAFMIHFVLKQARYRLSALLLVPCELAMVACLLRGKGFVSYCNTYKCVAMCSDQCRRCSKDKPLAAHFIALPACSCIGQNMTRMAASACMLASAICIAAITMAVIGAMVNYACMMSPDHACLAVFGRAIIGPRMPRFGQCARRWIA